MTSLGALTLDYVAVDDAGIANLPASLAGSLRYLYLAHTRITDTSLIRMQRFSALEELRLAGTRVTDRGLEFPQAMKQLKSVDLTDTDVSIGGIARLREVMPTLTVEHK